MSLTPLHLINTRHITHRLLVHTYKASRSSLLTSCLHKVYRICTARIAFKSNTAANICNSNVLHVLLSRLFVSESRLYVTAAFNSASCTASAKTNTSRVLYSQQAFCESYLFLFFCSCVPHRLMI